MSYAVKAQISFLGNCIKIFVEKYSSPDLEHKTYTSKSEVIWAWMECYQLRIVGGVNIALVVPWKFLLCVILYLNC